MAAAPKHPSSRKTPAQRTPGTKPPGAGNVNVVIVKNKRGTLPNDPTLPDDHGYVATFTPNGERLYPTFHPEIFRNNREWVVKRSGEPYTIEELKQLEAEMDVAILGSQVNNSPAELLRRVSMDPRLPLHTRIDAANKAAPYFNRKQPISTEFVDLTTPAPAGGLDLSMLTLLPRAEREAFLATLLKLGFRV